MNCQFCGKKMPDDKLKCKFCGKWQGAQDLVVRKDGSILLQDVKSANIQRIQTGPWDYCWGVDSETGIAGPVRGSTTLLAGSPGAGKSTLQLQMCSSIPDGREVLYLAAEEQLIQIKARADRLGIKNQHLVRMVECMTGEGNIEDIIRQYRPGLLILDSLNGMAGSDMGMTIKIAHAVKIFCMQYDCVGILTSHITKSGEIAGLEGLQHEVDATMTFFPELEIPYEEEAIRKLEVEKNRNGRAFIHQLFEMTEKGLVPFIMNAEEEEDDE